MIYVFIHVIVTLCMCLFALWYVQFSMHVCNVESVCMTKRKGEGEKGGEEGGRGGEGERAEETELDEEMVEVRGGVAGGQGLGIRDKWMSSHEITPLAIQLLSSSGVCHTVRLFYIMSVLHYHKPRILHSSLYGLGVRSKLVSLSDKRVSVQRSVCVSMTHHTNIDLYTWVRLPVMLQMLQPLCQRLL